MDLKILKRGKNFSKEASFSPSFFWNITLAITGAVVTAFLIWGYFIFEAVNQEPTPVENQQSGETQVIPKERIDRVLEYFAIRAKKSAAISNTPTTIIDPSL